MHLLSVYYPFDFHFIYFSFFFFLFSYPTQSVVYTASFSFSSFTSSANIGAEEEFVSFIGAFFFYFFSYLTTLYLFPFTSSIPYSFFTSITVAALIVTHQKATLEHSNKHVRTHLIVSPYRHRTIHGNF